MPWTPSFTRWPPASSESRWKSFFVAGSVALHLRRIVRASPAPSSTWRPLEMQNTQQKWLYSGRLWQIWITSMGEWACTPVITIIFIQNSEWWLYLENFKKVHSMWKATPLGHVALPAFSCQIWALDLQHTPPNIMSGIQPSRHACSSSQKLWKKKSDDYTRHSTDSVFCVGDQRDRNNVVYTRKDRMSVL